MPSESGLEESISTRDIKDIARDHGRTSKFDDFDDRLGKLVRKMKRASNRNAEALLREADEVIDGFGVEAIRDGDGDVIAEYVNTGDTYNPTFVWDYGEEEMYYTSWGDWVEDYERRTGERLP